MVFIKLALFLTGAALLAGCGKTAQTRQANGSGIQVGSRNGCAVYRAKDAGRYTYFSSCGTVAGGYYGESCGTGCVEWKPRVVQSRKDRLDEWR